VKAIRYHRYGGPEELRWEDCPDVAPARSPLPECARSLTLAGLLAAVLGACGTSEGETVAAEATPAEAATPEHPYVAPVSEEAQRQVQDMIESLKPLDPTLTSDYHDQWFIKNQKLIADLKLESSEVGRAALQAYYSYEGEDSLTRAKLLTVAAHVVPEDTRETLRHLMLNYGYPIDDRTEATLLLAATSPESFLEDAREHLERRQRASETMPNDEFFIRGWVTACEKTGVSPVPMLADVVTNLVMEDAARHYAAQALGRFPDPLGQKALEVALAELTGNHYLRRKAAQALRDSLPRETACQIFQQALDAELDVNMQEFLEDMIATNCR